MEFLDQVSYITSTFIYSWFSIIVFIRISISYNIFFFKFEDLQS